MVVTESKGEHNLGPKPDHDKPNPKQYNKDNIAFEHLTKCNGYMKKNERTFHGEVDDNAFMHFNEQCFKLSKRWYIVFKSIFIFTWIQWD